MENHRPPPTTLQLLCFVRVPTSIAVYNKIALLRMPLCTVLKYGVMFAVLSDLSQFLSYSCDVRHFVLLPVALCAHSAPLPPCPWPIIFNHAPQHLCPFAHTTKPRHPSFKFRFQLHQRPNFGVPAKPPLPEQELLACSD